MKKLVAILALGLFLFPSCTRNAANNFLYADKYDMDPRIQPFNDIHLEMSLKPFKVNDRDSIDQVCRNIFLQWAPLLRHADTVSVMLWTADGSEILNYTGDSDQRLEWAQYVGNPNTEHEVNSGPKELSLHQRAYDYIPNPPFYTYGDLKYIVSALKKQGEALTGKVVRIGETFDPGPEFAKSEFKYKKHPEICMGNTMGAKTFVCCYATLNEDKEHYAGYPDGIPQGTPFGTFFGKQSQHFLTDMGFDFLWFSNGLGFGMETWGSTGAVFDGKRFHPEKLNDTREKIGWEKAHIFRHGKPAICTDPNPPESVTEYAHELLAPIYVWGKDFLTYRHHGLWDFEMDQRSMATIHTTEWRNLPKPAISGVAQLQNAAGALAALAVMQDFLPVTRSAVVEGLENVVIAARFDKVKDCDEYKIKDNPEYGLGGDDKVRAGNIRGFRVLALNSDEHEHVLVKTDAVAPTCSSYGGEAFYRCTVCARTFSDAAGEPPLPPGAPGRGAAAAVGPGRLV